MTEARLLQQQARRQFAVEQLFELVGQPEGGQRVQAGLEQVGVQRHVLRVATQQARRQAPDGPAQGHLAVGAGLHLGAQGREQRGVILVGGGLGFGLQVQVQDLQPAGEVVLLAAGAPDLAAGGAWHAAAAHQGDGMDRQVMFLGDRAADAGRDGGQVRRRHAAFQFLHQHQPLAVFCIGSLDREGGAVALAQRGVGALRRPLDVLRVVVAPADDDQVLQSSGDEQLAIVDEAEVAGAQEGACAFRGARVEAVGAVLRLAPVAPADAAAAHPDLADLARRAFAPGLRVDDAHLHAVDGAAAAHHQARRPARAGGFRAAGGQGLGVAGLDALHSVGGLEGDGQHRLGHAVAGREGGAAPAVRTERGLEAADGFVLDRLGAAGGRQQAVEPALPGRRLLQGPRARGIGEVGRAGVRDPEVPDRVEPAQRAAQEGQRRHQVAGRTGMQGPQQARDQAVVMVLRQPAQGAAVPVHRQRGHGAAALGHHVGVREDRPAWRAGRAGGVLQVGHVVRRDGRIRVRLRQGIESVQRAPGRGAGRLRRGGQQVGRGQHQGRLGIVDDGLQSWQAVLRAHRVGRRHRHRDAAAQHAAPEVTDEGEARRVGQQDPVARAGAGGDVGGGSAGLLQQFGVGPARVLFERVAYVGVGQVVRVLLAPPEQQGGEGVDLGGRQRTGSRLHKSQRGRAGPWRRKLASIGGVGSARIAGL